MKKTTRRTKYSDLINPIFKSELVQYTYNLIYRIFEWSEISGRKVIYRLGKESLKTNAFIPMPRTGRELYVLPKTVQLNWKI